MERIHVAVRARPLSPEDAKTSPWKISANSISLSNHSTKFDFDRIFGEECRTAEVYEARTREIVAAAVRGFNGTVFAYGQTNSGKTHTMRGSAAEPGVIPLAVRELFHIIQEDMDREFLLRMSYMEIYNEEINDLLAPEHRKLQIHESLERGIFVAGLREEIVASPEQVLDFMEFGESHRHIGETNMNVYSSRSHTIFRMIIESRDRTEDDDVGGSCDAVRVSVLNLVDLAGSERAAKTGAEGVRLKEGSHINKSLMTLGTVIKKLSEGAECQGGHVPYRDSKLTRILQPALGGNANTAIICNITLAQIHADETKSSLQFASRALRVTNCARVNEILTDAALLKRQKKEIEELRAKLMESHSEHFEEEILNLRNTLLQSELERERIALELQEEKKAHALREMRLQEQAKRIENLSSLVLNSQRDEAVHTKRNKRRDTWCIGASSGKSSGEVTTTAQSIATIRKPVRTERDMGLPPPFEELIHQNEVKLGDSPSHLSEDCGNRESWNDYALPDEHALLHVTNRRKVPLKKKNSLMENSDVIDMEAEYEDLLLKFETQGITKDIQIEWFAKKLAEAECDLERTTSTSTCHLSECVSRGGKALTSRESEAILVIKQLQDQIKELETEKSSIQENLDNVVQLATKQNSSSRVKYDQLHQELLDAREEARVACEEARVAREQLCSLTSLRMLEDKLLAEFNELVLEVQNSRDTVNKLSSVADDLFQSYSFQSNITLDLKSFASQNILEFKSVISDHEKLYNFVEGKVVELEKDKSIAVVLSQESICRLWVEFLVTYYSSMRNFGHGLCGSHYDINILDNRTAVYTCLSSKPEVILHNHSFDQQKQIEDLKSDLQNSEKALTALHQQQELEKDDFITEIQNLQKEISSLSSSFVVKEKETLRRELEKTKSKLKDTECKLKNAVQDKIRLESEKAFIEREIKHLRGQKTLLERDISKRESLADKRRESLADWRRESKDLSKAKAHNDLVEQGLQLKSIELERANFDLEILSGEYEKLEVHVSAMEMKIASLEENLLAANGEKEEVLARNEIIASELEATSSTLETTNSELETLRQEVSSLTVRLSESESLCERMESSLHSMLREKEDMAMQLTDALLELEEERAVWSSKEKASVESIAEKVKMSNTEIALLSKDLSEVRHEMESCREQCRLLKERLTFSEENAERERKYSMESTSLIDQLRDALRDCETKNAKFQDDAQINNKEKAKYRMRLRMTQAKLDMHRRKYSEAVDEMEFMHRNYKDGTAKLKEKLASTASENLNLKKRLTASNK